MLDFNELLYKKTSQQRTQQCSYLFMQTSDATSSAVFLVIGACSTSETAYFGDSFVKQRNRKQVPIAVIAMPVSCHVQ